MTDQSREDAITSLMKLAREATNGWACHARTKREQAEIGRLHRELDSLASLIGGRPNWQPIETAPKLIPVLVYMDGTAGLGVYRAVLGDWSEGEPLTRWRPLGYMLLDNFPVGARLTKWKHLDPPGAEPRTADSEKEKS